MFFQTEREKISETIQKIVKFSLIKFCNDHHLPQSRAPVRPLPVPEEHHAGQGADHTQGLGHVLEGGME